MSRFYTIVEAQDRPEKTWVKVTPAQNTVARTKIPWTIDSGVAKSLLSRKHFEAIRRMNRDICLRGTATRFVAYGSRGPIPLIGKLRVNPHELERIRGHHHHLRDRDPGRVPPGEGRCQCPGNLQLLIPRPRMSNCSPKHTI